MGYGATLCSFPNMCHSNVASELSSICGTVCPDTWLLPGHGGVRKRNWQNDVCSMAGKAVSGAPEMRGHWCLSKTKHIKFDQTVYLQISSNHFPFSISVSSGFPHCRSLNHLICLMHMHQMFQAALYKISCFQASCHAPLVMNYGSGKCLKPVSDGDFQSELPENMPVSSILSGYSLI